ncbi:MAG: YbjQ family protein [Phycisphaerales bacterium]|nr:YbjQ family protein [Phycisphaerales bacterium]
MNSTTNIFGEDPFDGETYTKTQIDQDEIDRSALVLITTTPTIEGKRINQYHGVVFGESAYGIGIGTGIAQVFQDVLGTRGDSTERRLEQVRLRAMARASDQATTLGGNAIVGARVDYEFGAGMVFVCVTGTAVSADL